MASRSAVIEERITMPEPEIELQNGRSAATTPGSQGAVHDDEEAFFLSPADGGKDAWLFLAASFLIEALVWGFPFAFGIFQDYYRTHEDFAGSSGITAIGTTALGIMYLDMPVVMGILRLYPRVARWSPFVGLLVMSISLAASSFSTETWHLILTQGIMYAVGGSFGYNPCLLYMPEWFVRRRGLAYGVMWAGTGLGGFAFPLLFQWLLGQYGFRTALRVWSVGLFVSVLPLTYFIKPRLPASANINMKPHKLGFVLQPTFLIFMIPAIIESAGYFLPTIYLPTYARSILGASSFGSALTVILINLSSTIGLVVIGNLADRIHSTTCILTSTVGAVLGVFFLWGFSVNLPLIYTFCVVYGFFAGSYVASWPKVMGHVMNAAQTRRESQGATSSMDPIMVIGFLAASRGLGNLVSGPLSEALIRSFPWKGQSIGGWGSGYGPLIAFTGVTAAVGGMPIFWKKHLH